MTDTISFPTNLQSTIVKFNHSSYTIRYEDNIFTMIESISQSESSSFPPYPHRRYVNKIDRHKEKEKKNLDENV